jgi:hypothetical protein
MTFYGKEDSEIEALCILLKRAGSVLGVYLARLPIFPTPLSIKIFAVAPAAVVVVGICNAKNDAKMGLINIEALSQWTHEHGFL